MGKPVNLNRYRKEKARAQRKARANENAVKFGRSKSEKELEQAKNTLHTQHLDGHKHDESS